MRQFTTGELSKGKIIQNTPHFAPWQRIAKLLDSRIEDWPEILLLCWVFVRFRYQGDCGFIE